MNHSLIAVVFGAVIGFGILAFIIVLVPYSLDRLEIHECMQWQGYAKTLTGFYLTQTQNDQCVAHGIIINAPIK